ncbi:MAG TPA: phosphoribosylformylglycinamidine synthase subunit PurL [Nitrososphaeraceae archaeon]|nr:phosphoribosylformylglycinamidine synthase subunit PurL [Nitrososphaeraceae archaeon]
MSILTDQELSYLARKLKRRPNSVETDIIGVEWSEHCSYKSSKKYLRLLPTRGPRVLIGAGQDAAALDVGDGYVISVHIESHNHPSAIEPYGGAATGVGGVIRDIISIGTRPIAVLDALRFGPITDHAVISSSKSKWLLKNVVSGIGDYGNCIGVPTVGGEVEFDSSFENYCLVDVASIGIARKEHIIANKAETGDLIILAGGSTGRDGIHGASFASAVLEDEDNRSAVQIPDPFLEKLLLEATMEAVGDHCIKAMKDLGGGGLACCLSETADSLGRRFDIELDSVHTKHKDMTAAEIMISESQERMLYITDKSRLKKLRAILDKYEIKHAIIGTVKEGSTVEIKFRGVIVASLPSNVFAHAPLLDRPIKPPEYLQRLNMTTNTKETRAIKHSSSSGGSGSSNSLSEQSGSKKNVQRNEKSHNVCSFNLPNDIPDINEILIRLMSNPTIASKKWIYSQYDHEVGIRTVSKPGCADASVLKLENGKFISVKLDGNSKHCYLDPYNGAMGCLSESVRNIICTGAEPIGIVDHLQFASPEDPEIFWTFVQTINAIKDYCEFMNIPVVGGKVSFYNETNKGPIKPSPVIGSIGIIQQEGWITESSLRDGDSIFILGVTYDEMGGSEYYEYFHDIGHGTVPKVNLAQDKLNANAILHLIKNKVAGCVHDCSKGGLGIALAEMAIQGEIGITIDLSRIPNTCSRVDNLLFSESHSRFIFGTNRPTEVTEMLAKFKGVHVAEIGKADKRNENLVFGSVNAKMNGQTSDFSPAATREGIVVANIPLKELAKSSNIIENIMSG